TLEVGLRDADGKPVANGEVALIVVDEAILALTGYRLGSPLGFFYPYRSGLTATSYLRPQIVLAEVKELLEKVASMQRTAAPGHRAGGAGSPPSPSAAPMLDAVAKPSRGAMRRGRAGDKKEEADRGGSESPIGVRIDFRALALFEPALRTDADGKARVEMKV